MKELRYVDAIQLRCSAVFCKNYDIVYAGTTIASMPDSDNNDTYKLLADEYDIRFVFDSNIPVVNFYAIPRVDIFAVDSNNGYWGTAGAATDIDNTTAQICYISKQNEVFIVAENLKNFIFPIDSINERKTKIMEKAEDIKLYLSKEDAEKVVKFIEISKSFV